MSGIAQGIEKASYNLFQISLMKDKLKKEEEEFDLNKKVKNAQLKVYEFKTSPEEMLRVKNQEDLKDKIYEMGINLKKSQISNAEQDHTQKLNELQKEKETRIMSGVGTLKDLGMSDDQARYTLATMWSPQTANVGNQQIQVAPPEFVEKAMSFDRGEGAGAVSAPVINAEAEKLRSATGITKEQAANTLYGVKEEKAPTYTEDYRKAIEEGSERIHNGEKSEDVIKELRAKYPASMNYEREWTLKQIEKDSQKENAGLKNQAIKMLQDAKYPATEANIQAAIKQLRGR